MNKLTHIDEFRAALENYHVAPAALRLLAQTKFVMLIAPTSTGRNTVIRHLLKTNDYYFIVSDTTRKPRSNDGIMEQNGIEYWFRSEVDVLADIEQSKYLEAAIIHNQQVSGVSIREFQKAFDANKIALTDAEIAGAHNALEVKPDTIAIFMLPPNFEEWQRRIKQRGDMEAGEYRRRMVSATKELAAALAQDYYKFVINDTVERTAEHIHQIAKMDHVDAEQQADARNSAERLFVETKILLKSL